MPRASNRAFSAVVSFEPKSIYSGRQDAAGKSVFPGFEPGGEANAGGWAQWITGNGVNPGEGSLQLAFGVGYFANMVFEKPDWDFRRMNFDADVQLATAKTGQALDATDTNLERFKAAGGRLIQVHGWSDAALPPSVSIQYYEAVAAKSGGVPQTQSFYRLLWPPACSIAAVALVRTRSAARLVFRHRRMMRRTTSCRRSGTGSRMGWRRRRSWPRNTRTMTHKKAS
jgi:Tannase and feruloyl esterase